MSLLINDELIWISIPRCASHSIESALLSSNLKITKANGYKKFAHPHVKVEALYDEFGKKETFCIKRNWLDRWFSSLEFIFSNIEQSGYNKSKIKWCDVDNQFIYDNFNPNILKDLYSWDFNKWKKNYYNIFTKTIIPDDKDEDYLFMATLAPQNIWKGFETCTYEFDITDLDKFVNFIENKFGEKIKIEKINSSKKEKNKIIIDDELKNFIYNNFEKVAYEKEIKTLI
jgi:hypothetical protein